MTKPEFSEKIKEKLKLLPDSPGVYKMLDENGEVIYVGKAKVLKNRVRQYFRSHNAANGYENKVRSMVSHIADFEYIITSSETEALMLESNLIKQFMPHYNILLKDDKHFPYLRLDLHKDFPNFTVTRKLKKDGARYWGPYLNSGSLRDAITAIRELFPVRHCKKSIEKAIARRERPCLMYHINKCCAPCSGNVTREEYHELLGRICKFLDGDTTEIIALMTEKMMKASEEMDYEQAAVYRDRIYAIKSLSDKQRASQSKTNRYDVFATAQSNGDSLVFALFVHDGKVIGTQNHMFKNTDATAQEVTGEFIKQFYAEASEIPHEILTDFMPEDSEAVEEWFRSLCHHAVHITCPQRGEKRALVQMAQKNAQAELTKCHELQTRAWERGEGALCELSALIGLDTVPERIECYDNSHIQGTDTVGAMVVFENGEANKKEYRRFRISQNANGDDYLAMEEMLRRRLEKARQGDGKFANLPDLIIADGGRGQLNVVLNVLAEFNMEYIHAIGLAERNEEIILPDYTEPLILEKNSASLHLVQRIRDEAHRFAITYHRNVRSKNALYSVLDEVDGIGEKRKRALYERFITLDAIRNATPDELRSVPGMNAAAAEKLYNFFRKQTD
ncbi:MAG: excinuclease ABC subunit UvrC [Clostridia bacterium]|nr:excinuclease ABC subunit UvrC [Clostridia bacterium]